MKCPECGSDGCSHSYFSHLIDKEVTVFVCDKNRKHHFLIAILPPAKVIPIEDYMNDRKKRLTCDTEKHNK